MIKRIIIIVSILIIGVVVYNYYYVNNYNFSLNGNKVINLNISDTWEDPLYTIDNDKEVTINNNIDFNKVGNYEVNYIYKVGLFSKTLTRNVNIFDKDQKTDLLLSLKGSNPYYLMVNHSYKEAGYEAYDIIDGLLTNNVIVTNNIDEKKDGNYEIKYQIKNSSGVTKTISRDVVVYSFQYESKLKTEDYVQENEIILNISDKNYSYTILPDETRTSNRTINYLVNENNTYEFKLYDINDNMNLFVASITNIDHEKPTGSCTLSLKDTGGIISVNATDNHEVQGYEYQYGNTKSNILKENSYTINTMDEKASITIYDTANNSDTISCKTIDNSTKKARSYTLKTYNFNGTNKKYWFYEPKISVREKVPLVIYFHGDGGSGSTAAVNNIAIPKNLKDGEDFPYYVVAPYVGTQENFVLELINYLIKNYNIDSKRIILSGGSSGSPAALRIASNNPNKFSSIVIISSFRGTPIYDVTKLTYLPIWFFQGSGDMYSTVEEYVNKINNAGGNAKLTQYKGGHDAPVNAFLRTDLTNWILANKAKQGF